jgi:cytochrome c oxidase subunit 2
MIICATALQFVSLAKSSFAVTILLQSRLTGPGPHSVLHPRGPEGTSIEHLFWILFGIVLVVFILVIAGLAAASARSYTPEIDVTHVIEDEAADRRATWFVGTAAGITVITLFIVLFLSVKVGRGVQAVYPQNSVTIQITAHQWWWEFTYPSEEPDLQITTANEVHVPTRTHVLLLTRSSDVIHSFWAPSITGKRDLVPGYTTSFSFQVDRPGIYHGQCAEFCGLQHAHMGFAVVAEPLEDFEAWKQNQVAEAKEPNNPETKRGQTVFLTHACVMCHTIRGTTAAANMGPDLTHVGSRMNLAAETIPNNPGFLAGWIVDPQNIKPGNHMAPNALSGQDLQALITYLESLQ